MTYNELMTQGYDYYKNMQHTEAFNCFKKAMELEPHLYGGYLMLADVMWHYMDNYSPYDAYEVVRKYYVKDTQNAYIRLLIYFLTDELREEGKVIEYNYPHLRNWLEIICTLKSDWPYPKLLLAELITQEGEIVPQVLIDDIKKYVGKVECKGGTLENYLEQQYTGRAIEIKDDLLYRLYLVEIQKEEDLK